MRFYAVQDVVLSELSCIIFIVIIIFYFFFKYFAGMMFFSYMVEDKTPSGLSYVEFLVHIHRQIQSKMAWRYTLLLFRLLVLLFLEKGCTWIQDPRIWNCMLICILRSFHLLVCGEEQWIKTLLEVIVVLKVPMLRWMSVINYKECFYLCFRFISVVFHSF